MGKGAITRGRILDEAMKIASRDGLEGLTIGGLAKVLTMSKSGLFVHFGSKEALQVAVLEHTCERFGEFVGPSVAAAAPGMERLQALFKGWLDWIDNPELPGGCPVLGASFELDDREGPPRDVLVARQKAAQRNLAATFKEVVPPGTDLEQLVFELRGITLAYHYMVRVMRDPAARQRAGKAFEELLRRASGEPSPARPSPPSTA